MGAAIEAQEPVTVDLRNYRKDGSMFWNRVTTIPIRDDSGTVSNFLGYQQDISAEKRFEEDFSLFKVQAVESEKAIVITDTDGTIQYVNPAFERVNGYTSDEAIGRTPVPSNPANRMTYSMRGCGRRSPLARSGKKSL